MKYFIAGQTQTIHPNKESEYNSFLPSSINRSFVANDQSTITLLEEATRLIGELNAYSRLVPDIDYFIQMHVKTEAVSSSRIEGTRTEIDEVLLPEEEIDPERRDDWREVRNYIDAMNWSIEELKQLPVSLRLIKETHSRLLAGVRGTHKLPGEIRTSQNWIGGSSIRTAHFVPPTHEELPNLLSDWEKFWHNSSVNIPVLIKIAIMHYQFETIHPFLDGNGRIGRLLITLQLIERDFLTKPVLYISDYFEEHRQSYYDSLDRVRRENDLENWVRFFLEGIVMTSKKGKQKFENIITLRESYEYKIATLSRKVFKARKLLLYLFSQPIVSVRDVSKILEISYRSANALVIDLVNLNILQEKTGYSRNRLFEMKDYVTLFRK
ncbi:MAG TPA: Fic family protein [Candidatus Woesebacteria bacterium]|nr:Fic family protein [Candidatus Woesebacteria bacterium]